MKRIIKATRIATAPVVVAVALLAACGADNARDVTDRVVPDNEAPAAAAIESRAAHYERLARAEALERTAKLEGQTRTYSKTDVSARETTDDQFVPGSRHMPTR